MVAEVTVVAVSEARENAASMRGTKTERRSRERRGARGGRELQEESGDASRSSIARRLDARMVGSQISTFLRRLRYLSLSSVRHAPLK